MERIKQALEKAREDRLRAGMPASLEPRSATTPVTQISYSQTNTQQVKHDLLREQRIITGNEKDAAVDAYKILRTQVLQRLNENNWNTLAVTSPGDSEGKTLTAINLGIALAQEVTYTVLLVDVNLRRPSVHTHFGLTPEKGLSDYLTGNISLSSLLIHPAGIERFVVLPGGAPLANSSEMLNSPKMKQLVEELKERYRSRIILFDLPPLLTSSDALAFAPYVDAFLMVVEEGKSPASEVQRAAELLTHTHLLGTVLNKSQQFIHTGVDSEEWLGRAGQTLANNKFLHTAWEKARRLMNRLRKGKS